MLKSQTLQLEMSTKRERLNAINALEGDAFTPEIRAEASALQTEYTNLETRFRSALILETNPDDADKNKGGNLDGLDPETRALEQLKSKAKLGEYFAASLEQRDVTGAELELREHFKVGPGHFPLSLLEERSVSAPTDVPATQEMILPTVFPATVASFLGVPTPRVSPGEKIYSYLSTAAEPSTPAESASVDDSPAVMMSEKLTPARVQASLTFSKEDASKLAGLSDALRQHLISACTRKMDSEVLLHTTEGLLTAGITAPGNPRWPETGYADYRVWAASPRLMVFMPPVLLSCDC